MRMNGQTLKYFCSVNPLARNFVKDELAIKNAIGKQWDVLDWKTQDDLINDVIVDISVRQQYSQVQRKFGPFPQSFPIMRMETGEKVWVDFENDCWTWQDEHSSPFDWRTKSQQDLTLNDLEPDVICKPLSKKREKKATSVDSINKPKPEHEFSVAAAGLVWQVPLLQGIHKPDLLNRSSKSVGNSCESLTTNHSKTPEEVNYAFAGSVDNVSSMPSVASDRSLSMSNGEMLTSSQDTGKCNKTTIKQRSFSKSPITSIASSSRKLHMDIQLESHVPKYENNIVSLEKSPQGHEWSSFVNDTFEDGTFSATPSPLKSLLKEPEPINMDRDQPEYQSGVLMANLDDFNDDILVVEKYTDVAQSDSQNISTMSKTGFDFLDNW